MAVTGDPVPPEEAMPPLTWNQPAQPLEASHQSLMVRPSEATANTSRCSGKRATTLIGVRLCAGRGGQRGDPVPDYLTTNMAKRNPKIAHLAVELRPIAAAVIVVGTFE